MLRALLHLSISNCFPMMYNYQIHFVESKLLLGPLNFDNCFAILLYVMSTLLSIYKVTPTSSRNYEKREVLKASPSFSFLLINL